MQSGFVRKQDADKSTVLLGLGVALLTSALPREHSIVSDGRDALDAWQGHSLLPRAVGEGTKHQR